MADEKVVTPVLSTKGILSISIVWVFIGLWAYAIYTAMNNTTPDFNAAEFLLQFAGATSVMGMIVILVVQNFFRKTEAA